MFGKNTYRLIMMLKALQVTCSVVCSAFHSACDPADGARALAMWAPPTVKCRACNLKSMENPREEAAPSQG